MNRQILRTSDLLDLDVPEPLDDAVVAARQVIAVGAERQAEAFGGGFLRDRRLEMGVLERTRELFVLAPRETPMLERRERRARGQQVDDRRHLLVAVARHVEAMMNHRLARSEGPRPTIGAAFGTWRGEDVPVGRQTDVLPGTISTLWRMSDRL